MRIKVKEIFRGLHRWDHAGEISETKPVSFLANKHAHDFRVTVECEVAHDDRELEFYLVRNTLRDIVSYVWEYKNGFVEFGSLSCEMIGSSIVKGLVEAYGENDWIVEVAENEYQSALVRSEKTEEQVLDIDIDIYDGVLNKARTIFVERQSKYGNSVNEIDLHTIVGLMRMKLFRIYNEGAHPKTQDELLDTINYAVFALTRIDLK